MTAALALTAGAPLRLEEVSLDPPQAGEVLVRLRAVGVCHTDLHYIDGAIPKPMPFIPGHEGAGEVLAVGPGVATVSPGDRCVLTFLPSCGRCRWCGDGWPTRCVLAGRRGTGDMPDGTRRLRRDDGETVGTLLFVSAFAEHTVVPEASVVPVQTNLPWSQLALLGCGVTTGFAAVTRALDVGLGESLAVVGCGGVGLAAVHVARAKGAGQVVAVDVHPDKLDLARRFGASDTVLLVDAEQAVEEIRSLTGGSGTDFSIEAVGGSHVETTIAVAYGAVRVGGTVCVLGLGDADASSIPVAPLGLLRDSKRILGSLFGDARFRVDVPRIVGLAERGQLDLGALVSRTAPFSEVNNMLGLVRDGAVQGRVVLDFDQ